MLGVCSCATARTVVCFFTQDEIFNSRMLYFNKQTNYHSESIDIICNQCISYPHLPSPLTITLKPKTSAPHKHTVAAPAGLATSKVRATGQCVATRAQVCCDEAQHVAGRVDRSQSPVGPAARGTHCPCNEGRRSTGVVYDTNYRGEARAAAERRVAHRSAARWKRDGGEARTAPESLLAHRSAARWQSDGGEARTAPESLLTHGSAARWQSDGGCPRLHCCLDKHPSLHLEFRHF